MFRRISVFSTVVRMSKKFKSDTSLSNCGINTRQSIEGSPGSNETNFENVRKEEIVQLASPVKSPSDKKSYSVVQLTNGLTATLISDVLNLVELNEEDVSSSDEGSNYNDDAVSISSNQSLELDVRKMKVPPTEEKLAACCLSVQVGSFSDPEDIQGLAHFLEHMVFMGSQKYPKENEFDSFITKNGGSDNATTECEYTTFYFECQEKYLEKALDIFSQFFKTPLMKKEAMTRERKAVESEFQLSLPSDTYRKQQLLSSTANKENPARKFTWGNQKTLSDNVTDDYLYQSLHNFRKKHYSAHRMKLAIQARLPEETLKNWVIKHFSGIENNNEPPEKFTVDKPFSEEFNKLYYVESIADETRLDLNWVLPPILGHYKSKPLSYLSFIVGHEGKGSLLSYLKSKLWALSLYAGHSEDGLSTNSIYSVFSISVILTDLGRSHVDEVLEATFSYLKMLHQSEPDFRLFTEIQAISDIDFKFAEEHSAVENVEALAENMHYFPPEDYLTANELMFEYQPKLITHFLSFLTPKDVNVIISAKGTVDQMQLDKVEPWFQTKYSSVKVPKDWIMRWSNIGIYNYFHLPEPNDFITTDFAILSNQKVTKYPVNVKSTDLMDIWYKADNKFNLPNAFIGIQLVSNKTKTSAIYSVLVGLYLRALKEMISEELYPANVALLDYSLEVNEFGISFSVYGFNQKLNLILLKIAEGIEKFPTQITEGLYDALKESMVRMFYNQNLKISSVARDLRMSIIVEEYFTCVDKLKALNIITYETFLQFAKELYQDIRIQCLIQGNITKEEGIEICNDFASHLDFTILNREDEPKFTVLELPHGENCVRVSSFNVDDKSCVTTNYYQFCPGTIKDFVTLELILLMMEEPLFDKLRTQEQLGYDVNCTVRESYGIIGFTVTVLSQIDKFTMEHVKLRMDDFIHMFYDYIKKLPDEEFKDAATTLTKLKTQVDLHLKEEVSRNWSEIKSLEYVFDRPEKEVKFISSLKKKNLQTLLHKHLWHERNLKKLSIQVVGHTHNKRDACKNALAKQQEKKLNANAPTGTVPRELRYNLIKNASGHPPNYFIADMATFKRNLKPHPHWKLTS